MELKINLSEVRALSKEQRQGLARVVRQQPELFNAINGMGGLSETANFGQLQGTLSKENGPIAGAEVKAVGKTETKTTKSDQYGFYKLALNQDVYVVTFKFGEETSEPKEFDVKNGITATADYRFK